MLLVKNMKIRKSEFIKSAVSTNDYPDTSLPELAFVGRSNVGKSSLLNMLLNRKNLAKTASTPGKTRLINFFNVDDKFRIVDLPGYGYAKVSKEMKKDWGKFIEDYLNERENLLEVFLLLDIRHRPTPDDIMMYHYIIDNGFSGYVFCTKLDKIKNSELMTNLNVIKSALNIKQNSLIIPISSVNKKGKYKAWDLFNSLFQKNGYDIYFEKQEASWK